VSAVLLAFPILVMARHIQTPLEACGYPILPQSKQVKGYLEALAKG
jgi:hypothetical protein